ncbi:MAG: hypothetical protein R3F56_10495 [Planctomycetota bacterium]
MAGVVVAVLLLHALWVPFHLASESHFGAGGGIAAARSTADALRPLGDQPHHPHAAHDHLLVQDRRTEDPAQVPVMDPWGLPVDPAPRLVIAARAATAESRAPPPSGSRSPRGPTQPRAPPHA